MQTFVPSQDNATNARLLDNKRLNKQALEAWQILMTLTKLDPMGNHREPKGWVNHPAVKMWRGHELALAKYAMEMVTEWKARGFNSTLGDKISDTVSVATTMKRMDVYTIATPPWMGDEAIHSSHRKALLVKDYEWYSQFGWAEDPGYAPTEYEYTWPVS
jgi:hypothetical protein